MIDIDQLIDDGKTKVKEVVDVFTDPRVEKDCKRVSHNGKWHYQYRPTKLNEITAFQGGMFLTGVFFMATLVVNMAW